MHVMISQKWRDTALFESVWEKMHARYEGESISNLPNLFPVEIHLFFFDVIAL